MDSVYQTIEESSASKDPEFKKIVITMLNGWPFERATVEDVIRNKLIAAVENNFYFKTEDNIKVNKEEVLEFWKNVTDPFYKKDLGLNWETIKFYSSDTELCLQFLDAAIG